MFLLICRRCAIASCEARAPCAAKDLAAARRQGVHRLFERPRGLRGFGKLAGVDGIDGQLRAGVIIVVVRKHVDVQVRGRPAFPKPVDQQVFDHAHEERARLPDLGRVLQRGNLDERVVHEIRGRFRRAHAPPRERKQRAVMRGERVGEAGGWLHEWLAESRRRPGAGFRSLTIFTNENYYRLCVFVQVRRRDCFPIDGTRAARFWPRRSWP